MRELNREVLKRSAVLIMRPTEIKVSCAES